MVTMRHLNKMSPPFVINSLTKYTKAGPPWLRLPNTYTGCFNEDRIILETIRLRGAALIQEELLLNGIV